MGTKGFATIGVSKVIWKGEDNADIGTYQVKTGQTAVKPGTLVIIDTADNTGTKVITAPDASPMLLGVVKEKAGVDPDTAFSAGDVIEVIKFGRGTGVWCIMDANINTVYTGNLMQASVGGVGYMEDWDRTNHATADHHIRCEQYLLKDASDDVLIRVTLL